MEHTDKTNKQDSVIQTKMNGSYTNKNEYTFIFYSVHCKKKLS